MRDCEYVLTHFKCETFEEWGVGAKYFVKVDFKDRVRGYIGCLLVEASVDEDVLLDHETNMPESIDVWQFVPI